MSLVVALTVSGQAVAAEELLENVVVRNRLFRVQGKLEVSPTFGLAPVTWLTEHYNFNVGAGYNLLETLAFEARGGYALTRQTSTARRIAGMFLARDPNAGAQATVDDFSNLWEMNANLVLGIRWAPIYGKLSLLSETPVHFQAYLWAGGGAANFSRQSIVYCTDVDRGDTVNCNSWLTESRMAPVGSAAVGFRFFTHQGGALKLELRDYIYSDRYRTGIDRVAAEQGNNATGTDGDRGLANIVLIDLGYTFFF